MQSVLSRAGDLWHRLTALISGEWMLTFITRRPNGGGIVIARAIWAALWIYLAVVGVREALDPGNTLTFSAVAARVALRETIPWFGAILGATYASLYARFSSQWTYLAELYNKIKAAEVANVANPAAEVVLAEWKAGFIEDADDLHQSSKPLFASIIRVWGREPLIATAFAQYAVGGAPRLTGILEKADEYCSAHRLELPPAEARASAPSA